MNLVSQVQGGRAGSSDVWLSWRVRGWRGRLRVRGRDAGEGLPKGGNGRGGGAECVISSRG